MDKNNIAKFIFGTISGFVLLGLLSLFLALLIKLGVFVGIGLSLSIWKTWLITFITLIIVKTIKIF